VPQMWNFNMGSIPFGLRFFCLLMNLFRISLAHFLSDCNDGHLSVCVEMGGYCDRERCCLPEYMIAAGAAAAEEEVEQVVARQHHQPPPPPQPRQG